MAANAASEGATAQLMSLYRRSERRATRVVPRQDDARRFRLRCSDADGDAAKEVVAGWLRLESVATWHEGEPNPNRCRCERVRDDGAAFPKASAHVTIRCLEGAHHCALFSIDGHYEMDMTIAKRSFVRLLLAYSHTYFRVPLRPPAVIGSVSDREFSLPAPERVRASRCRQL